MAYYCLMQYPPGWLCWGQGIFFCGGRGGKQVLALVQELPWGSWLRVSVPLHVGFYTGLLGLPYSMAAGFQK